jgi:hypothetical protein
MAEQQSVARKPSRSKRDKKQEADAGTGKSGPKDEVAKYEQDLAAYLQERIKPGLNSGAIPLLARSIAKDIAHREHPNGTPKEAEPGDEPKADAEDEPEAKAEDEPKAEAEDEATPEANGEPEAEAEDESGDEADDEPRAEADDEDDTENEPPPDFEADMRELQAELGDDWILRFSVHGDDGWLTAEKDDGTQRVEAPEASVLVEAVGLLNERGGRSA